MRIRLIASAALLLASHAVAQPQNGLNLMPMPTSAQPGVGWLPVDQSFSVAITGFKDATEHGIHRFVGSLSRQTGMFLIAALHTLAEVVEPVKDYTRMNSLKTVCKKEVSSGHRLYTFLL